MNDVDYCDWFEYSTNEWNETLEDIRENQKRFEEAKFWEDKSDYDRRKDKGVD